MMLGLKTSQVALSFGADDLDGTVVHEKIYHEAGAETPQEATVNESVAPSPRRDAFPLNATRSIIASNARAGLG